jgi:hypothetical protein
VQILPLINGQISMAMLADRRCRGLYNCAIVERVRAKLTNIYTSQYPGFGIGIAADGDPFLTGPGNVNGFHNDHIYAYFHGKAGLAYRICRCQCRGNDVSGYIILWTVWLRGVLIPWELDEHASICV